VFKKLDKLIIKAFIGPFAATFFIVLLVLILQFFWLYIDDFVGKGLGGSLVLEFVWYLSATLVPLALPLAVLLSSLMTFGNLGESFELVAIKAAGISLLRFMRPLFVIALLLSGVAFVFANYVIPVANLKQRTLLSDIVYAKPAFDLKEGVFYDKVPGFAIKIGRKEKDSIIHDVIVYEQGNPLQDNFIIAKSGVMRITPDKRFLEFNLRDGWRLQERGNYYEKNNSELVRLGFKEYSKQFDISTQGFSNRTADSVNRNNEKMYSMRQLEKSIDSMQKDNTRLRDQSTNEMVRQLPFAALLDSAWSKPDTALVNSAKRAKTYDAILPDSARENVTQNAVGVASSVRISAEGTAATLKDKARLLRKHKIEWHRKIVLSLACLVLFLIGAPLGSIIRKGGLGTPLIFAIIFFMLFYFSSTMGEKFAKENTLTPFTGMWMATFILLPLGIFLTYKAMRDSHLFNKEFYLRVFRMIRDLFPRS
jgi:lipopolysaccharide export system permease protein